MLKNKYELNLKWGTKHLILEHRETYIMDNIK